MSPKLQDALRLLVNEIKVVFPPSEDEVNYQEALRKWKLSAPRIPASEDPQRVRMILHEYRSERPRRPKRRPKRTGPAREILRRALLIRLAEVSLETLSADPASLQRELKLLARRLAREHKKDGSPSAEA